MKLTYLTLLALPIIIFSCKDEPQENVVSIEDVMGETGEVIEEEVEVLDTLTKELTTSIDWFIHGQLTAFDTLAQDEFHPLDRFSYNQKEKIRFKSKEDVAYGSETMVTPRADWFYYTFSDTLKTKNAFYNWLDGFTQEGTEVKLNEDVEALKTPPFFTLVYDTVIIIADYRCEDKRFNWKPFEDSVLNRFGKDYNYRMDVGCGGPLTWK